MSAGCPKVMEKTILVVEDEKLSRTIILATLEAHGLHCMSAKDGQEALNLLGIMAFELILTDLRMPVLNGLELIKAIRNGEIPHRVSRDIPIVVLSAEEGEMIDSAISLGISGYFIKKEPIDKLIPKLKQLLQAGS
jgi:CheY-like chemotaxis protein